MISGRTSLLTTTYTAPECKVHEDLIETLNEAVTIRQKREATEGATTINIPDHMKLIAFVIQKRLQLPIKYCF